MDYLRRERPYERVVFPGPPKIWGRGRLRYALLRLTCRAHVWGRWRYETRDWFEYLAEGEGLFVGCWRRCRRCHATEWCVRVT